MAIKMRRGNEADFDPSKMLPGEWAVSTDTKYVRMCFATGIVLRMATYEAFESDMAEIRKILLECQSIQTAVELIQKNVTDSELVIENYVKESKQYRDEAEQFRNETEQFKNEAFSTTSGLIINNTASGDTIHLTDSAKSKVLAFGLYGKALQNKYTGKNRIPYPYYVSGDVTSAGVEFKDNGIGVITCNGQSTAQVASSVTIAQELLLPQGSYILNGCPSGGSTSTYRLRLGKSDGTYLGNDIGEGFTFALTEDTSVNVIIQVIAGYTAENLVFKPMIRPADITDDTYEPYVGGIPAPNPDYPQEITISRGKYDIVAVTLEGEDITEISGFIIRTDGLAGIPVDSDGNYTDENGQQWICDEIVKYADGTGKRIQRIGKKIFEGVNNVCGYTSKITGASEELTQINLGNANSWVDAKLQTSSKHILSDKFIAFEFVSSSSVVAYTMRQSTTTGIVVSYVPATLGIDTISEANTWLKNNPVTIYYILAEPIETDLTADELKVYENLQTFYPVTNVSNNANCGMSITYVADTKNYIDSKIASLEKALYNNI